MVEYADEFSYRLFFGTDLETNFIHEMPATPEGYMEIMKAINVWVLRGEAPAGAEFIKR